MINPPWFLTPSTLTGTMTISPNTIGRNSTEMQERPIVWYSKSQRTVETSTFGSEFVTLKTGVELIKSLQYKLYMMGIPIKGPANVLVDNDSVVHNSTIPSSVLQRKHNSICYHFVRESIA